MLNISKVNNGFIVETYQTGDSWNGPEIKNVFNSYSDVVKFVSEYKFEEASTSQE